MTSASWHLLPEHFEGSNITNDLRSGTFAGWVTSSYDHASPADIDETEQFWLDQGFTIERLASRWSLPSRDAFAAIIRLEFPAEHAARIISSHQGLELDYNLLLIHRSY